MRVDDWRAHNTYVNETIVHERTIVNNDAHCYSGGPGGIRHDPAPGERSAMREQHTAPTRFQQQHFQAAQSDRNSYVKNNGGRPQNLAVARPLTPETHGNPGGMRPNQLWVGLGVTAVLVVFSFSRRSGPVRDLPPPARAMPIEFLEALGSLYRNAGAASTVVAIAWERFRRQTLRLCGLRQGPMSAAELATAIRKRFPASAASLETDLAACEDASLSENIDAQGRFEDHSDTAWASADALQGSKTWESGHFLQRQSLQSA